MRREQVELANGRTYEIPAFFPNPQTGPQATLLRELISQHDLNTITGVVVNLEDMDYVRDDLGLESTRLPSSGPGNDMKDMTFAVIPDLTSLFGVLTRRGAQTIFDLGVLPQTVSDRFEIADAETGDVGRHMKMMGLYPLLADEECIRSLFDYEIAQGADFVSPPSIPINSKLDFDAQLIGQRYIFEKSAEVTVDDYLDDDRDLMHVVSLDPSVFDSNRRSRVEDIVQLLSDPEPDVAAVKLTNFTIESRQDNQSTMNALQEVRARTESEIYFLNVREFGLISFLYGVDVISSPIASSPYLRISEGQPPRRGNYYHKEDLEDYSRDDLMMKRSIRRNNYRFPCDCEACSAAGRIHQLDPIDWNDNRRRHFIFTKESEVRQLRDTTKPLNEALRDKFGRSEHPEFTAYLN